jgi:Polyketide cyclase / dehydrase and lipid transport.
MEFAYSIVNDDGPLPVSDYSASVSVTDKGDGVCEVVWTGTFEPKGASEEDASKIVEGIYRNGIAGARAAVEG